MTEIRIKFSNLGKRDSGLKGLKIEKILVPKEMKTTFFGKKEGNLFSIKIDRELFEISALENRLKFKIMEGDVIPVKVFDGIFNTIDATVDDDKKNIIIYGKGCF